MIYKDFELVSNFKPTGDQPQAIENLVNGLKDGKKIYGYGASTKGNTVLQYCDFTDKEICPICENRNRKIVCVVKDPKDILAMENIVKRI